MPRHFWAAAVCGTLFSGAAGAHALLRSAVPAAGSTLATAPAEVIIGYSEGVEPHFSTIVVQNAKGERVDKGDVHIQGDNTHLAVGLPSLPAGTYKVIWHATSVDTHKTQGSYTFTVTQ
jgi:methionine-rich copper-binding protein CopC